MVFRLLGKLLSGSDKTTVYTMLDKKGKPLYVGMSKDTVRRFKQHAKSKEWYPEVAKVKTKKYKSRTKAMIAEKKAIKAHSPLYNVIHNRKTKRSGR